MNDYLDSLRSWYNQLQPRERLIVSIGAATVITTVFYLAVWEPIHNSVHEQNQRLVNQQNNLAWMQQASSEITALKSSGVRAGKDSNQATSVIVERSANNSGIRSKISKLEASGKKGVKITLNGVSFDQLIVWLNELETRNGLSITSLSAERTSIAGTIDARLTIARP